MQLTAFEAFKFTDEATNEAAAAVRKKQKRSSGSQVESKMEALIQAEEAFTARQGTRQLNVILAWASYNNHYVLLTTGLLGAILRSLDEN